jgi:hypothetical protein
MKTGWLLQAGIVLAVGVMGLVSCTKEQLDRYTTRSGNTVTLSLPGSSDGKKPNSQEPGSPNAGGSSNQRTSNITTLDGDAPTSSSGSSNQKTSTITTPEGDAPTSNSGSRALGSGSSGPDVNGLRIGMPIAEARATFKSHVLKSDILRKYYKETSKTLATKVPGQHVPVAVPNGHYINSFETRGEQSPYTYYVLFAPVPGREEIVSLSRTDYLVPSKKPTFDAFEKTLFEKYGTPTYSEEPNAFRGGVSLYWSYNSDGTLQKPGFIKDIPYCANYKGGAESVGTDRGDWVFMLPGIYPKFEQLPARCGAIQLVVTMGFDSKYVGRETFISSYTVYMNGFDAVIRALKTSKAIVDQAQADESKTAIKKGQQQKPDF